MRRFARGRMAFAPLLGMVAVPASAQSPDAGKAAYQSTCGGCHSVDANRVGPLHRGVVGRAPGSVPGYAYSTALKRVGGVWTPIRLNLWLQNPQKFAPGSKMYLSVPDAGLRANIIAYLQSVSPKAHK
jgi:cytochrome c